MIEILENDGPVTIILDSRAKKSSNTGATKAENDDDWARFDLIKLKFLILNWRSRKINQREKKNLIEAFLFHY